MIVRHQVRIVYTSDFLEILLVPDPLDPLGVPLAPLVSMKLGTLT